MTRAELWEQEFPHARALSERDAGALEKLSVEPAGFIWLLREYKEETAFLHPLDFVDYAETILQAGDIPSEISCLAYNTGNDRLVALADELEGVLGAWFPNPDSAALRARLEAEIKAAV